MTLRSAIQEVLDRDDDRKSIAEDKQGFLGAWKKEIESLFDQMRLMLKPIEDEGNLSFDEGVANIIEDGLGAYDAPSLAIVIGSQKIVAAPVARMTVGGRGRVDLFRDDRPSEQDRFRLLKGNGDGGWLIETKNTRLDPVSRFTSGLNGLFQPKSYTIFGEVELENTLEYLLRL